MDVYAFNQSESSNSFFLFLADAFGGGAFFTEKSSSSSLNKLFFLATAGFSSTLEVCFLGIGT
jgi:hypothetical protein